MVRKSSHVVVGRVVKTEARWVNGKIVTSASLEIVESLKGTVPAGKTLTVSFLGGRSGVIEQDFSHEATLESGEVVLLFLSDRDPPDPGQARLRILGENGKQTLLRPGMAPSRLQNNRRLVAYLNQIRKLVQDTR